MMADMRDRDDICSSIHQEVCGSVDLNYLHWGNWLFCLARTCRFHSSSEDERLIKAHIQPGHVWEEIDTRSIVNRECDALFIIIIQISVLLPLLLIITSAWTPPPPPISIIFIVESVQL